jgi:hypothetical protein
MQMFDVCPESSHKLIEMRDVLVESIVHKDFDFTLAQIAEAVTIQCSLQGNSNTKYQNAIESSAHSVKVVIRGFSD